MRITLIILLSSTIIASCKTKINLAKEMKDEGFEASIEKTYIDTIQTKGVKHHLEYLQHEWANVPNPFIAKYTGASIGDYFHIIFEDSVKQYDFGDGYLHNKTTPYKLYSSDNHIANKSLLNKKFNVFWGWKESKFACCEGEMDIVSAKVPCIYKLILIE